ncbi:MAG: metallophosphoesterase [Ezakiella sp.]|nr:metallophosphoesterase [Ezakiella sp.]MDD7761857.1 metallophosphoesterase [Bacillota bacterium]MDY3946672.1 metallophosphoesterase [Ezakiella sp.]
MIKFLYFTDTHIRQNNPAGRIDNFMESLLKKFEEISYIVKEYNVDFCVHGGDILDRPDVSIPTIRSFNKILMDFGRPIFLVPGNHDIFAYNLNSIQRTVLALQEDLGVFNMMMGEFPIYMSKDGTSVELHSAPYSYELDNPEGRDGYIVKEKKADFAIMFAHGMLMDKPFPMIRHTLIEDIKDTKADLTLSGHYHTGFPLTKIDDKFFYNPGSIARISATEPDIKRVPKVVVVTLKKDNEPIIETIELKSAQSGDLVLDRAYLEEKKNEKLHYSSLKTMIESNTNSDYINVKNIIESVANLQNIDQDVKDYAISLVEEVQSEL